MATLAVDPLRAASAPTTPSEGSRAAIDEPCTVPIGDPAIARRLGQGRAAPIPTPPPPTETPPVDRQALMAVTAAIESGDNYAAVNRRDVNAGVSFGRFQFNQRS